MCSFGAWVNFIGVNWFLREYTGSGYVAGLQMMIYTLSGLIIAPLAGNIVDKYSRKSIITISNITRLLMTIIAGIFVFYGLFVVEAIIFLSFVNGAGFTIYCSCTNAFIQEITHKETIGKANSMLEISLQSGSLLSAPISGIIYNFSGITGIFIVNAACFFLGILFLIPIEYEKIKMDIKKSWISSINEGFKYLLKNRDFLIIGVFSYIPKILGFAVGIALPVLINDVLSQTSVVYGFSHMSRGTGSVLVGMILIAIANKMNIKKYETIFLFFSLSIAIMLLGIITNTFAIILVCFFQGVISTVIRIFLNTILMEKISKEIMGRTASSMMFVTKIFESIVLFTVGLGLDKFSIDAIFFGISIFPLVCSVVIFFSFNKN